MCINGVVDAKPGQVTDLFSEIKQRLETYDKLVDSGAEDIDDVVEHSAALATLAGPLATAAADAEPTVLQVSSSAAAASLTSDEQPPLAFDHTALAAEQLIEELIYQGGSKRPHACAFQCGYVANDGRSNMITHAVRYCPLNKHRDPKLPAKIETLKDALRRAAADDSANGHDHEARRN